MRIGFILIAFFAIFYCHQTLAKSNTDIVIHVSTNGSDLNNGSRSFDNGNGDGPVFSIKKAQNLARETLSSGKYKSVSIAFSGGIYHLNEPINLSNLDSGSINFPVIYRPESGEKVIFSGEAPSRPWRVGRDGKWISELNFLTGEASCPTQLFNGNQRLPRTRWPISGVLKANEISNSGLINKLFVKEEYFPLNFKSKIGQEIIIIDGWVASRLWISGYNQKLHEIYATGKLSPRGKSINFNPGIPFFIENTSITRGQNGKWECDLKSKILRYMPYKWDNINNFNFISPKSSLEHLLLIKGKREDLVHDVEFRDITFKYTDWRLPSSGWTSIQADVGLPAAIEIENCNNINLINITIQHTGANGVNVGSNCSNVSLTNSHLYDLGGAGISIGSFQRKPMRGTDWESGDYSKYETSHIKISENIIEKVGRIQFSSTGIISGQANNLEISYNKISDLFYSGISAGWVWSDGPSLSHDNSIIGNTISNYGQGLLSDMGGIYTLGRQPRTYISRNRISYGQARDYGGWGLYADQGSSGIIFEDNVVSNTSDEGIFAHQTGKVKFIDNVVKNSRKPYIRCEPGKETSIEILYKKIKINNGGIYINGCTQGGSSR